MSHPSRPAPLKPPDSFYLSAAEGWIGLGNLDEAQAELVQVHDSLQTHPDVLEVRWDLEARRENWARALEIARELVNAAPQRPSGWLHHSYSLRRAPGGGVRQAWEALLPAAERFKHEPNIPYNLSCYACQLGELENARAWFKRAVAIGGKDKMKRLALQDPDLEPLWLEISQL